MSTRKGSPAARPSRTKYGSGLLYLLPAFLVFGTFQWFPIIKNFTMAFQDYVPGFPGIWTGLANFKAVFADPRLPMALRNTFTYVGICLVIGFVVPVVAAIAISELRRGKGFFRLAIYVPNIIPAIATYIIWRLIFNPESGLLNGALGLLHIAPQQWLLHKDQVLPSLAFMATWQGFGATAVLYMASLSGVNPELYESAELDGASFLQRVRYVTLPSIASTMNLLLILQLIATFQVLQEPFVMTAGGPNNASLSIMLLVYQYAFDYIEFGKAGALGSLVFLFLLALSFAYVWKAGLISPKEAG